MKGVSGLVIAIGLGLAAALFNFFYLYKKSQDVERVYFVGIARDIGPGERLSKDDLEKVGVPARWVGNLDNYAVRYDDRETVIDRPVWRFLQGGSLLLHDDLRTPPPKLDLAEDERAWPIPVSRGFVPSLIVPGAQVWFQAPAIAMNYPTPASADLAADEDPEASEAPESPGNPWPAGSSGGPGSPGKLGPKDIGPFTVVALGNRLGSAEVMRASKIRQVQENVLVIKVKIKADGSMEPRGEALRNLLERTGYRPLSIQWRPGKPLQGG